MCKNCPEDETKLVELRFVGGKDKIGMDRGPFHSFETGKIYTVIAKNADLSFWEPVDGDVGGGRTRVEEVHVHDPERVVLSWRSGSGSDEDIGARLDGGH